MARMGGAKEHSAAFWPVLFLALLSWLVLLAGTSIHYLMSMSLSADPGTEWRVSAVLVTTSVGLDYYRGSQLTRISIVACCKAL